VAKIAGAFLQGVQAGMETDATMVRQTIENEAYYVFSAAG